MKAQKKIMSTAVANTTLGELQRALSDLTDTTTMIRGRSMQRPVRPMATPPTWIAQRVSELCRVCNVHPLDLIGDSRAPVLVHARRFIVWTLRHERVDNHPIPSFPQITAAIRERCACHSTSITMYQYAEKDERFRRPPLPDEYGKQTPPQEGEYAN